MGDTVQEPGTTLKWFGAHVKSFGSRRNWLGTELKGRSTVVERIGTTRKSLGTDLEEQECRGGVICDWAEGRGVPWWRFGTDLQGLGTMLKGWGAVEKGFGIHLAEEEYPSRLVWESSRAAWDGPQAAAGVTLILDWRRSQSQPPSAPNTGLRVRKPTCVRGPTASVLATIA
jgi:hypothetical protein